MNMNCGVAGEDEHPEGGRTTADHTSEGESRGEPRRFTSRAYIRRTQKKNLISYFISPHRSVLHNIHRPSFTHCGVLPTWRVTTPGRYSPQHCGLETDRCSPPGEKPAIQRGRRPSPDELLLRDSHDCQIKAQAEEACGQRCEAGHETLIWISAALTGAKGREGRDFVNDDGGGDASEWQPTCAAVCGSELQTPVLFNHVGLVW